MENKRELLEMLDIAQEKRWIICNFEEMMQLIEYLYHMDAGFLITEIDSEADKCTLFLK